MLTPYQKHKRAVIRRYRRNKKINTDNACNVSGNAYNKSQELRKTKTTGEMK